jgi:hypothetical protein
MRRDKESDDELNGEEEGGRGKGESVGAKAGWKLKIHT